jgi:hypothetical protein
MSNAKAKCKGKSSPELTKQEDYLSVTGKP